MSATGPEPGAHCLGRDRVHFTLWAPGRESVEVLLEGAARQQTGLDPRAVALERQAGGYWSATLEAVPPGTRYQYRLDGEILRPDPASHYQPEGVHAPSAIVDHGAYRWDEGGWQGLAPRNMVLYELHVGTFTAEGTFAAVIPRLAELASLGVTALELMPVAQFPGERNWGYDGVYPYAVQSSYGGPETLKELVAACHRQGLAVVLDVVYNHLGPEGNYLRDFGPYFTDRYRTPWGEAINLDGPDSDPVRAYFLANAEHWFRRYRIDALRLDAIHALYDRSAVAFLRELSVRTEALSRELGRPLSLIAESDLNDSRVIRPPEAGGLGLQAQWSDDLHHALHALLTGERQGYYQDFGRFEDLIKAYRDRFVYDWQYSPHRRRRHGNSAADLPFEGFVVFSQNHDQVGNRLLGERTSALLPFEALKLLGASILLSPYLPLLFMGEEYGETAPFPYFISHTDPELVEAVRRGRREEFSAFAWQGEAPDPQDSALRGAAVLQWELRSRAHHRQLLELYTRLLALRRRHPALGAGTAGGDMEVSGFAEQRVLVLRRRAEGRAAAAADEALVLLNFSPDQQSIAPPISGGGWHKLLDSAARGWGGTGDELPARLEGPPDGPVRLHLAGYGFAVYGTHGGPAS